MSFRLRIGESYGFSAWRWIPGSVEGGEGGSKALRTASSGVGASNLRTEESLFLLRRSP